MPANPAKAAPPTPKHPPSKTFRVSLWVIGALVLAQIGAVAFAIVRSDLGNRALADRRPAFRNQPLATSTTVPAGFPSIEEIFAAEREAFAQEQQPPRQPYQRSTAPPIITDPLVRDKVEFARLARDDDDIQTALEQFREANQQAPGTPEILYELASCYSLMDLNDEASDVWVELRNLGPERGGEFYKFAELALMGRDGGAPAPLKLFTISNHHLHRHPQETRGQMITLRASIKAHAGADFDHNAVHMRVLFFDLVNGRTIARSVYKGNFPMKVQTEPLDWADNPPEEIIDYVYFRPYDQENPSGEQRKFYGFAAQLFYEDEWQDLVTYPSTILEEIRSAGGTQPDLGPSWIDDSDSSRVENSLFPQS